VATTTGRELPYKLVAGSVPCAAGWLLVSAKLKGATFVPEFPKTVDALLDVIQRRPAFTIVALNAPIADTAKALLGERSADLSAEELLGRTVPECRWDGDDAPTLGPVIVDDSERSFLSRRYVEMNKVMAPYLQRTVMEVLPDLAFYQLNGEQPLPNSIHSEEGYLERRELLAKVPGVGRVLDAELPGVTPRQLLEGAALMWSARRIASRAGKRVPRVPEWDESGLRVEILR
jgi:predicted RNase H-like nuclease